MQDTEDTSRRYRVYSREGTTSQMVIDQHLTNVGNANSELAGRTRAETKAWTGYLTLKPGQ